MDEFDAKERNAAEWSGWEQNANYEHAIVRDGKRYPVKHIVSIATGVPKTEFSGGPEANSYVEKLGFAVEPVRSGGIALERQIFIFTASNAEDRDHLRT